MFGKGLEGRLRFNFLLLGVILVAELVGGYISHSLALLSDAGHVFADEVALLVALWGARQQNRSADAKMTFGYHRVGILTAFINGATLVAVAAVVSFEAVRRIVQGTPEVQTTIMLSIGSVGLAANILSAYVLRDYWRKDLNAKAAFFNVVGDTLGSVAVLVGAGIIAVTDLHLFDPAASLFIAGLIVFAAWRLIRETVTIFLEATPGHLEVEDVVKTITSVPGVQAVHDLHIWSLSATLHAMSCHLILKDLSPREMGSIRSTICQMLNDRYHIEHATLQLEGPDAEPDALFCHLSSEGLDAPSVRRAK